MNVRIDVLDERIADCVAGWLHSRADVMLFGGARLPFPLAGRDLLATSDDGWVVLAMKVDGPSPRIVDTVVVDYAAVGSVAARRAS